ncbi:MAG: repeat protein [Frankiales bacterium]|nr:repeat protein [Frankiales bacterium]
MRLSRRAAVVLAAVLLSPAVPSIATTGATPVVAPLVRTVQLAVGATTARLAEADQLVGVTWASGDAQVRVRWLTPRGWTAWEVPEDDSDVPEAAERRTARKGTEPVWRPRGATLVDVRVAGAPRALQLVRVGDGQVERALSFGAAPAHADARGLLGGVRTRADWGADESLRSDKPSYASAVRAVVVHHTAGGNDYTQAEVPKKIRADYAYHVKARGWSDLGYNIVVDKFGGIWEGRAGGLGRATIGSHAAGFNTGTLGVSLLGDTTKAAPTAATVRAMARVAAYAGGTWQFDPLSKVTLTSGGSPRYRSGTKVTLGRIHGHKDTGKTACPGALYDRLGEIRTAAAKLLGPAPRINAVQVTGAPVHAPTPLVVAADLSRDAPWAVEVHDGSGVVVARATGEGRRPLLEWNGLRSDLAVVPAQPGEYAWHVRVDDGYHPQAVRSGPVQVGLPVVPL